MLIAAKVKTNSKKFEVCENDGVLLVSLTEPAEDNRANTELIKEMTKRFGYCRIVRGLKSKKKIMDISDTI